MHRQSVPWAQSESKQILEQDILEGNVTERSDPELFYMMHVDYSNYEKRKFKQHLKHSLQTLTKHSQNALFANNAVANAQMNHPRGAVTERGYPFWDTSPACILLHQDICNGLTDQMKPSELWNTRNEYKEFPLDVFRQHIYQEKNRIKASSYWRSKNQKQRK
jgi:hypothetical protein